MTTCQQPVLGIVPNVESPNRQSLLMERRSGKQSYLGRGNTASHICLHVASRNLQKVVIGRHIML